VSVAPPAIPPVLPPATARLPAAATSSPALARPRTAPDFELPDHAGNVFRLACELAAAGGVGGAVVVVFFRGHWCPYCRRYLAKLQSHLARLQAAGARLVAISPEPPATSRALVADLGLQFPVLADADGQVINRYGTRNGFLGGGSVLPHPSVFVVDAAGTIRFQSIDRNFKKRTTVRTLLAAVAEVTAGRAAAGGALQPAAGRL
jgi:peroxiredoxin